MLCIHDMDNQTISSAGSSDSLNRLKTVFEVCDEKNDGYITIEHFENLIREHFGEGESEVSYVYLCVSVCLKWRSKTNIINIQE